MTLEEALGGKKVADQLKVKSQENKEKKRKLARERKR